MREQDIRESCDRESLPHIDFLAYRIEKALEKEHKDEINRSLFMRPRLRRETRH